MALIKREYIDSETVITAENLNDIQDSVIALEDGLFTVDDDRSGGVIAIGDAAKRGFRRFNIYGKTTQAGTPTPDAPVDLVCAGDKGNIKLSVTGKNLLPYPFYQNNLTLNGITYTDNKDGTLLLSGTTTDPSSFWFTGYNFALKKGVTYTLSIGNEYTATGGPYLWINSSKKGIVAGINMTTQNSITFTPNDDYFDAGVYISASKAGITFTGKIKPQIEIGATATPFEIYKAQKLTVATPNGLPGIPVSSGGNYTDANGQQWICDEIDFTRGVYVRRVGTLVFDGTEGWRDQPTDLPNVYYLRVPDMDGHTNALALCSHFPHVIGSLQNDTFRTILGSLYFMRTAIGNDLSAWKAYLTAQYDQGNPVKAVYVLADTVETSLTVEERNAYAALYTYKDAATIFNDALADMELEYVMDSKKYFDSLAIGSILPATVE